MLGPLHTIKKKKKLYSHSINVFFSSPKKKKKIVSFSTSYHNVFSFSFFNSNILHSCFVMYSCITHLF